MKTTRLKISGKFFSSLSDILQVELLLINFYIWIKNTISVSGAAEEFRRIRAYAKRLIVQIIIMNSWNVTALTASITTSKKLQNKFS